MVILSGPFQNGTIYYPDNIPVTPGQLYFFEPVLLSAGRMDFGFKLPSSYPGGEAWNIGLQGLGDYWFREGTVDTVPEPGSLELLLLGSGVLFWYRSGKRCRSIF